MIDWRSDTVTRPVPEMLKVMMAAPLGDDVFREDPSVNALEKYAAELFGTEAALLCTSGTLSNQLAINVQTSPGDELLCDHQSHIFLYEAGGIAVHSGVQARIISGDQGRLHPDMLKPFINAEQDWLTRTRMVCIENTVNRAGGTLYTISQAKLLRDFCNEHSLKLHLDGARLFNALIETGESPKQWGAIADSISICLSKGLGAPVGSMLLGSDQLIKKARKKRKQWGGGMRQAGFIAAAGMYALTHHTGRLKEDHLKIKTLEATLKELPFVLEVLPTYTNIVIFKLDDRRMSPDAFERILLESGIRVAPFGAQTVRMVSHLDITEDMVQTTCKMLKSMA
jgi:threonine aldolase